MGMKDFIENIFGDELKAVETKKKAALKRFIKKMEKRHEELHEKLEKGKCKNVSKTKERVKALSREIKKTKGILKNMSSKK